MDQEQHQLDLQQVLVIRPSPVFQAHEEYISKKFEILKAYESSLPTHDFMHTYAQSVKVVICSGWSPITAEVLADLPSLELVVTSTAGVNHIDMAECRRRGIRVTNTGDLFSDDVADGAVGLLIDVMRRISAGDRFVRGGRWPMTEVYTLGSKLGGKKVGIVGLGNIGSRVATRLEAMGCIISYTSRQQKHSIPFTFYPNVHQLASNSDALVLCCSLTNNTHHIINKRVIHALGKNGVIVNVARGSVIDEVELVKCLVNGEIGGVGLDVFENEPSVPKELFGLDNVVILPHSTACTRECFYSAAQVMSFSDHMIRKNYNQNLSPCRRLYGILINDKQYVEDASFETLDKNARQQLLNLLNVAADKAFEAHAKMLGTQYITSYNPWSMPQEQSSDGLNPQPFSPSNAPTDFPSLQQVDYLTGESIFSDPTNQMVFPGQTNSISNSEYNVRLKRCRVCQKPKVKQLTKEMSIQDRNVLTLNNISQQQNRKRSWEVQNDPSRVEDSALTFDYVKSLALINLTDEEDQISREASTKILQIESRISSLQVAVKRVNLVDFDFESQPSQMGPTVMGETGSFVVGRSDPTNSRTGRRTWNPANELTLQSQPFDTRTVYTMSPGSQTSQVDENVGLRNQHNYMPEETYDYFHSGVTTSNSNTNRPLYREQMDQKHMDKKEVMGTEIMEWLNPSDRTTAHGRHDYEYQEAEFKREKRAGKMYKDQMNHYKGIHGKHEIVKPISMVSPSNSTSSSDSEGSLGEVYSGSSGSGDDEESESVMYSLSSQDHSPDMSSSTDSSESEPKLRKTVPKKSQKSGIKKELSMSRAESNSKPKALEIVPITGHKHGTSEATIPTKDHKKDAKNEPKMSSSSESSGSKSRKKDHHKHPDDKDHHHHSDDKDHHKHPDDQDNHKHPDNKEHHHHDKEHHHHSDNKDHHKKSIWQKAGKAFGHKKRKDEAYAEQAVNKVHSKAIVVHKLEDKKQKGHLKTLVGGVGGLIKHASHAKKSKKSKSVLTKIPSRKSGKNGGGKVGKKMQWWDMLRRQRKIKRIEKLRGKIAK
ncbi:D-isomer specific 2-hydroxyacid dehydrogenase family protein [Artemisia annua]|uniref:D-isomer specific 2-hydroxyacid dehydrogenase family protein n=1 Tax=Artemisia annua TaxID=35608 RepID=A0A2U1QGH4_ARTAN|nr:D-isomer specific 2-hydroxyacid dehydrogenase family protein [Artemisia annua]